jgi:hypothetical protein
MTDQLLLYNKMEAICNKQTLPEYLHANFDLMSGYWVVQREALELHQKLERVRLLARIAESYVYLLEHKEVHTVFAFIVPFLS